MKTTNLDRLNMILIWFIISFNALFIWANLAEGSIDQPLRSKLESGCHYLNPQLNQMARWLYCGCVLQKLDLIADDELWDQVSEKDKVEILFNSVYLPCTANRRKRA